MSESINVAEVLTDDAMDAAVGGRGVVANILGAPLWIFQPIGLRGEDREVALDAINSFTGGW